MRVRWAVFLCLAPLALFVTGCGCDAESSEQLCADQCGQTTLIDGCGNERQVDCGGCGVGQECQNHQCICEGATPETLCDEIDAECGEHSVVDRCSATRTVECGTCSNAGECLAGVCECQAESDQELCRIYDLQCGAASVEDRCGDARQLACGSCPGDLEACDANVCECVGESNDELCDAVAGACGTTEATDACGVTRTVECEPCAEGDSTFGAVRDANTGELLDDATIKVYAWPPPGGEDASWFWESGYRADDPDFETTTFESSGDINYEFASEEPMCADDQVATLEADQWYRYVVKRPGYAPGVFYRLHPGYSAGDCAAECAADDDAGCHRQDFELWEEGTAYPQEPNLVIDPRDMQDTLWQCALMPDDAPVDELIGFRASLGGVNTGQGLFHLEGVERDDGEREVLQHIHWSDGSVETRTLPNGAFEHHDGHGHIHFMDWFQMRFATPSEDCRDVDARPDSCVVHDGVKISFCIVDVHAVDGDIMEWYGGESKVFPDPPTCDTTEQGLTQGWRDTYPKWLPGQVIVVGPPDEVADLGPQWLEAEIDPERVLEESERHGNVARRLVEAPDDTCGDPEKVLDCSVPPEEYESDDQSIQCPDYLEFFD